jgi:hypothetical protein
VSVFRRVLLAALLCVSVWAADRLIPASLESIGPAAASRLSEPSGDTDSSNHQWIAGPRSRASLNESVWRSQFQYSAFAGTLHADAFRLLPHGGARHRQAPHTAAHLHRIPLLI